MAEYVGNTTRKKLIQIDISADTVCPWCFVGNRNLDKAIAISKDQYDFELRFHPFQLNPSAPKEGIVKKEFYRSKFGSQAEGIIARMTEIFRGHGLEFDTPDSWETHWTATGLYILRAYRVLISKIILYKNFVLDTSQRGNILVTVISSIRCRGFLLEAASKAGVEGAAEFLQDPNNGLNEVQNKIDEYSGNITRVPFYVINKKH
ncbi:DSBA oxidoreductase family protein [Quillaja saponaria]|uniref:DSBA oxidoreductase family protein n=1 Tax=Quillaja saponaria TaxID=32244 RepID=A0AAD7VG21_QUISA|nr:DSBA oxidoreductase family protein [Quillaja saponaria]